jgi:hypothetical protein
MFQEGNERVVCSGLFFLQKTKEFDQKEKKKSVFVKEKNKQKGFAKKKKLRLYASFLFFSHKKKRKTETQSTLRKCNCKLCNFRKEMPCKTAFVFLIFLPLKLSEIPKRHIVIEIQQKIREKSKGNACVFFCVPSKKKKESLQKKKTRKSFVQKKHKKESTPTKSLRKKSFQLLRKRAAFLRVLFASEKKKKRAA